ncbi:MAG: DNA-3-methyladenine glycosylase I [Longicatena sp.]
MEKQRCLWANNAPELYKKYHDEEWGVSVHDDHKLFEMLVLESFQAGLSWLTILKKRENFRKAFDNFDVRKVAQYDEEKIAELTSDKSIIRNSLKIKATIKNAQVYIAIQEEFGSFSTYLWNFTNNKSIPLSEEGLTHSALSDKISKDLYNRGMRFVGSVIIYAYLEAVGVLHNHARNCFLYHKKD